jgi:hypothetical protein
VEDRRRRLEEGGAAIRHGSTGGRGLQEQVAPTGSGGWGVDGEKIRRSPVTVCGSSVRWR